MFLSACCSAAASQELLNIGVKHVIEVSYLTAFLTQEQFLIHLTFLNFHKASAKKIVLHLHGYDQIILCLIFFIYQLFLQMLIFVYILWQG